MRAPRIQWDQHNVSIRETQLMNALAALHLRLAATHRVALGKEASTGEAQREVWIETLAFIASMFPDLNFRRLE